MLSIVTVHTFTCYLFFRSCQPILCMLLPCTTLYLLCHWIHTQKGHLYTRKECPHDSPRVSCDLTLQTHLLMVWINVNREPWQKQIWNMARQVFLSANLSPVIGFNFKSGNREDRLSTLLGCVHILFLLPTLEVYIGGNPIAIAPSLCLVILGFSLRSLALPSSTSL